MAKKLKIEHFKLASISEGDVPSDVLERIDGYEIFVDYHEPPKRKMYEMVKLKELATFSQDNDTNETTRIRIALICQKVKSCDYLMITNDNIR